MFWDVALCTILSTLSTFLRHSSQGLSYGKGKFVSTCG